MNDLMKKIKIDCYNSLSDKIEVLKIAIEENKMKIEEIYEFLEQHEEEEENNGKKNIEEIHINFLDNSIEKILEKIEEDKISKIKAIECFSEAIYSLALCLGLTPSIFLGLSNNMNNEYFDIWQDRHL